MQLQSRKKVEIKAAHLAHTAVPKKQTCKCLNVSFWTDKNYQSFSHFLKSADNVLSLLLIKTIARIQQNNTNKQNDVIYFVFSKLKTYKSLHALIFNW